MPLCSSVYAGTDIVGEELAFIQYIGVQLSYSVNSQTLGFIRL